MKTFRTLVSTVAALLLFAGVPQLSHAQYAPSAGSALSRVAGRFVASNYNYPQNNNYVTQGTSTTGTGSLTLQVASIKLPDGRTIYPISVTTPLIVGNLANQELVTPTAVSNCYTLTTPGNGTCTITASFTFTHAFGDPVISGTGGLAEAIFDAYQTGGGFVDIDNSWANGVITGCSGCYASANAALSSIVVYPTVSVEDVRNYPVLYWNVTPAGSTFLAVPTTLTATTAAPVSTPVGAFGTGTYHLCVAYVDIAGNEGACSLDFSEAGVATGSFVFTPPAASTGAVGYTIYISLTSGSYALAYQVPLTSTVCGVNGLVTLETVTPACKVTNATYGQTGATATVTAITVNTSPLALQLGAASTTSDYVGNSNARTTYTYAPGSSPASVVSSSLAFTAGPATVATTVPQVIGTIALPSGFINLVGSTIRLCGKEQMTNASATVEAIQLWWDGAGSNAAGVPVEIANIQVGGTGTAVAYNGNFCWTGHTTVAGASVTAGSIQGDASWFNLGIASAPVGSFTPGMDTFTAATASLNLAGGAGFTSRLHIVQLHTTGTDVSPKLVNYTLEILN